MSLPLPLLLSYDKNLFQLNIRVRIPPSYDMSSPIDAVPLQPMSVIQNQFDTVSKNARDAYQNLSNKVSSTFNGFRLSSFFKILIIVIAVVWTYITYRDWQRSKRVEPLFFDKRNKMGVFRDTKRASSIPNSSLASSDRGVEYTFSFWIHVNDSNYLNGRYKHIFHKGPSNLSVCNPGVFIAPNGNQLMIRVDTMGLNSAYTKNDDKNVASTDVSNTSLKECKQKCNNNANCKSFSYDSLMSGCSINQRNIGTGSGDVAMSPVKNIDTYVKMSSMDPKYYDSYELDPATPCDLVDLPLQRWNHVVIVLWNRSLDVYLNGKLARSCTLNHIPRLNNSPVYLTQNGGFEGDMATFRYFNRAVNADEVYSLYQKGYESMNVFKMMPSININLGGADLVGYAGTPNTNIV